MSLLTKNEDLFLKKLMDNYVLMSDKSFLSVLFFYKNKINSNNFCCNGCNDVLLNLEEKIKFEIIKNSYFIFEVINENYIFKYKDMFLSVDKEMNVWYLSNEIEFLPFLIQDIVLSDFIKNQAELISFYKKIYDIDYIEYVKKYKNFCKIFGFCFNKNYDNYNRYEDEISLLKKIEFKNFIW